MKTFKFTAYGKSFAAEAQNKLTAMAEANRNLIWVLEGKSGSWIDVNDTEFKWVEGNFFD